MNSFKKFFALLLLATIAIGAFEGCKKGPDDPTISFRSRKARVVGEWTVTKYSNDSYHSNTSGGLISTTTTKEAVDGSSVTVNTTNTYGGSGTSSTLLETGNVSKFTVTFVKDGTFSQKEDLTLTSTSSQTLGAVTYVTTTVTTSSREISGTWNFLGAEGKSYKNKERIILNILKSVDTENQTVTTSGGSGNPNTSTSISSNTNSYSNGEHSATWHLKELKNKEMLIDGESNGSGNYTSTSGSSVSTTTIVDTGKSSYTLTQK